MGNETAAVMYGPNDGLAVIWALGNCFFSLVCYQLIISLSIGLRVTEKGMMVVT
jgi:hypothetical protein